MGQPIIRRVHSIYAGEARTDIDPQRKFGTLTPGRRTTEQVKRDTEFALAKMFYYREMYDQDYASYLASQQEIDDVFYAIVRSTTPKNYNPKTGMFRLSL